jgi:thiol-disulfide isomerase/thioredoxin
MKVVAYHFWSPTCAPCKIIKPAIEDLKEEFSNVEWISVNTYEDTNNYSAKFGVSVVPTIVVTAGEFIERHSGTQISGYYRILRNAIRISQQS